MKRFALILTFLFVSVLFAQAPTTLPPEQEILFATDVIGKSGPVHNVWGYGAKGDGVTDDTIAIQKATDAASAVKGVVYFPYGTYKLTAAIEFDSYTSFLGSSSGSILRQSTVDTPFFENSHAGSVNEVLWKDLSFNPSATGTVAISNPAEYLAYSAVENCIFYANLAIGIQTVAAGLHISDCQFGYLGTAGASWQPLDLDGTDTKVNFSLHVERCGFYMAEGGDAAVEIDNGNSILFETCVFEALEITPLVLRGVLQAKLISCNFENINSSAGNDCLIDCMKNTEGTVGSVAVLEGCQFSNNDSVDTWDSIGYISAAGSISVSGSSGNMGGYYTLKSGVNDRNFYVLEGNRSVGYQGTLDHGGLVLGAALHTIKDPYNVKAYGAEGDGVTDDAASVTAAIAAMSAGDTLYFPSGTYMLATAVIVDVEGAGVIGEGKLYPTTTTAMVLDAANIEVSGLEIYGDGPTVATSAYGIDVREPNAYIHDVYIHDIKSSGVVIRAEDCRIENIRVEHVGWDMGLMRGGADRTLWKNCYAEQVGRSAVACDDDAEKIQIINCVAYNCGNTQYTTDNHHNVWHLEDANDAIIKGCVTRFDGDHDFVTNNDAQLAIIFAIGKCPNVIIEDCTVLIQDDFICAVAPKTALLNSYTGTTVGNPIVVKNCNFDNRSKYILQINAQIDDIEIYDSKFFGGFYCYQTGAETSVRRFINNTVDGNDIDISGKGPFIAHQYGYEEGIIIKGNTFERINGIVLGGRWQDGFITENTIQNCGTAFYLDDRVNDSAQDSDRTIVSFNTINTCTTILRLADSTALTDYNMFLNNIIMGANTNGLVSDGGSAAIRWIGNTLAADASITNLTVGSVGITIHEDLSSVFDGKPFNITDFGATTSATDNATAIQAAIDAAEVVGGTVLIPYGTYDIQSQLTITEPIILQGVSAGQKAETTIGSYIRKTADCNGIYVSAGATLRDFCVDSDGSDAASKCGIWIHVTDPGFRVRMDNVRTINQGGDGLHLQVSNVGQYDSVHSWNNGGAGIILAADSDLNCNANTFVNCMGYNNDANGISVKTGYDNVFIGGQASSNNGATTDGWYVNSYGNMFYGVYAEANEGEDFFVGKDAKANYIHVVVPGTVTNTAGAGNNNWIVDRRGSDLLWSNVLRTYTLSVMENANVGTYVLADEFRADDGTDGPGSVRFYEDEDNGKNYISLFGPSSTDTDNLHLPTAAEIAEAGYLYTDSEGVITTKLPPLSNEIVLTPTDLTVGSVGPDAEIVGDYLGVSYDKNDDSTFTFDLPHKCDTSEDLTVSMCYAINEAYGTASGELQWSVDWSAMPTDGSEVVTAPTHTGLIDSGDIDIHATANSHVKVVLGTIVAASISADDSIGMVLKRVNLDGGNDPTADPVVFHLIIDYVVLPYPN